MELKQAGGKTYYIPGRTNIGVFKTGEDSVCLIDTGSAGDGEKIDEIISGRGWKIDYIINTHTHIDHLGGNAYLMQKYGIPAYCTEFDMAFAHYADLEASYMNGGKPAGKLRRIFAHPGKIGFRSIEENSLAGIAWTPLPGHTFGMIGVKTSDGIWFLADSYLSCDYIQNHRFGYLCDVGKYVETLTYIKTLEGGLFIPAHGIAEEDIAETADRNIENVAGLLADLKDICQDFVSLDRILQGMYGKLGMRVNVANHALLSSTIKSYLAYLEDEKELECKFIDRIMMWKAV